MAKIRDVLKHIGTEVAKRRRRCHRSKKHSISAGEECLVITDEASGGSKNYCTECAEPILTSAAARLESIRSALGIGS